MPPAETSKEALQAACGELASLAPWISCLEADLLPATQHQRQGSNPLGPLVDDLDPVNSELLGIAARLAQRKAPARPHLRHRHFPRMVISAGRSSPVIRGTRNHRTRK